MGLRALTRFQSAEEVGTETESIGGEVESSLSARLREAASRGEMPPTWAKRTRGARRLFGWGGWVSLGIVLTITMSAFLAPWIAPSDPVAQNLSLRLTSPAWTRGGESGFLLGTDHLGRDVFSRLLFGARLSLALSLFSSTLAAVTGSAAGLYVGWRGGWLEDLMMRLADAQFAFPFLVTAIAIIAVLGTNIVVLAFTLALGGWAVFARLARGVVLPIKQRDFIEAARAIGAPDFRILVRHVLPNIISPLIVIWTFTYAQLIVVEGALSYLGLGIRPPQPALGQMLREGTDYIAVAWWLTAFPGLVLLLVVLGVNGIGDALRDVLDPHLGHH